MLSKHQQEVATGYLVLALMRGNFSGDDVRKATNKIARCFQKYDEAQAAGQGEYWLETADPDTL